MPADLLTVGSSAGIGGVAVFLAQTINGYFKTRGDRKQHREDTDATIKQHSDKLVFEVLKAAREEVAAARVEAAELRSLQLRMVHFDEAMEHLQLMLSASTPDERAAAERRASQFLKRMQRFNEAHGAIRNEAQVQQSRTNAGVIAAEAADILQRGIDDAS